MADKDCIFCKIVKGEIPSYKVYEDADFLAFLDIRPLTKGNTLIIPKKHFRWTYDVPNFGAYFEVAKKVGLATQKAFDAKWLSFLTLGWEVPHAHIRVIPRYEKDLHKSLVSIDIFEKYTPEEMKEIGDRIQENI
jgi:histidine triad (HIT) family protein